MTRACPDEALAHLVFAKAQHICTYDTPFFPVIGWRLIGVCVCVCALCCGGVMQQRDSYTCDDIEGAHAGWKPRHEAVRKQGPPHEIMKTDDIVFDGVFHSQRVSTRLGLGGGGGRDSH